ncbi:MAG TPA: hypothetical protein PKJ05_04060 [Bacillota bacterium]|nr:hypothetical protein [Bacillota bacterium]
MPIKLLKSALPLKSIWILRRLGIFQLKVYYVGDVPVVIGY